MGVAWVLSSAFEAGMSQRVRTKYEQEKDEKAPGEVGATKQPNEAAFNSLYIELFAVCYHTTHNDRKTRHRVSEFGDTDKRRQEPREKHNGIVNLDWVFEQQRGLLPLPSLNS